MDTSPSMRGVLGQYEALLRKSTGRKEVVLEVVSQVLGIPIRSEWIQLKEDRLLVVAHATIRTEIFLRKKEILEALAALQLPDPIREIL